MLLTSDFYLDIFSSAPSYLAPQPILLAAPAFAHAATLESKNMSSNPILTTAEAINPLINKLNPQGLKPSVAAPSPPFPVEIATFEINHRFHPIPLRSTCGTVNSISNSHCIVPQMLRLSRHQEAP